MIIKKEIMNCILVSSMLINMTVVVILGLLSTKESIHDKECILPPENTRNHENGKCLVFTKCNFEIVNDTYHLVSDEVMILPTTYMIDIDGANCPRYYDLPGYKYFNSYDSDLGYGYCEVPFNVGCSQLMFNVIIGTSTIENSGHLYTLRGYDNEIDHLSYAKTDEHGTNCPKKEDMACVDFSSIYDVPTLTLTITLNILILINLCECIYRKQSYKIENNEETQILQGVV